ncbi:MULTISPECIES: hypothetical protein [Pontibacter]|uniref:Uncharacterized protein n=1 Tax=Pontibacter lucknowensis TaxID=1077936 RepID=A0A1N7A4I7_9BACT|nr:MULTISPECIES: hypothetical protein [Pontibacter]EJF11012.1 hypothetical protein O71_05837 [Pontibacter sp. BAB1700]SIR33968.1 hypothetical protein SAMN05421545_3215 [Pontibacter lucknowensis]
MAFLRFTLFIMLVSTLAFFTSCSPLHRSDKAIVVDDYGSMRYIKGKQDRVHKKWKAKSSYKPRNNKVATRRNADW